MELLLRARGQRLTEGRRKVSYEDCDYMIM